jgi:hypothetical protein
VLAELLWATWLFWGAPWLTVRELPRSPAATPLIEGKMGLCGLLVTNACNLPENWLSFKHFLHFPSIFMFISKRQKILGGI